MAESVTIARPYAEALFRAAKESGNLAKWAEQVSTLAQVAASPDVRSAIGDPNVAAPQLVDLFGSACGTAVDAVLANFIQLLSNNDRLGLLPEIAGLYESYKRAEEGSKQAEIISAFPIDDNQVKALVPQLEAVFKTKLETSVSVDSTLIGGIKVIVGDQMLDASVRGKLDAMATALKCVRRAQWYRLLTVSAACTACRMSCRAKCWNSLAILSVWRSILSATPLVPWSLVHTNTFQKATWSRLQVAFWKFPLVMNCLAAWLTPLASRSTAKVRLMQNRPTSWKKLRQALFGVSLFLSRCKPV
jgi:F-type H+-transporting ATPase subunit delta